VSRNSNSATLCALPWLHFHAEQSGQSYPCCLANKDLPIGQVGSQSISEIWNSSQLKDVRKRMMEGEEIPHCRICYDQEKLGFKSNRLIFNEQWKESFESRLKTTSGDGQVDSLPTYLDIRFSNVCNLRCRSCHPHFSSSWYEDGLAEGYRGRKIVRPSISPIEYFNQIEPLLPGVEQIYFSGGEPLLTEEHYFILQKLIDLNKTDVFLQYNTNMTVLGLGSKTVLDYWKQFNKVVVSASIDASGEKAEYLRKGSRYQEIVDNYEKLKRETSHVDFFISPTLSIYNSLHVLDLHKEWVSRGLRRQDIYLNILQGPSEMRIDRLPKGLKSQVESAYRDHHENFYMPEFETQPNTRGFGQPFLSAIEFMNQEDGYSIDSDRVVERIQYLDTLRNENFEDVFPELSEIIEGQR
jgi:sulfatase maturation enzyme AslB (radical SAM superfamily)